MGVYIKGMRMPKGCDDCRLGDIACEYDEDHADRVCYLVEVNEPHGRLIDAEDLAYDLIRAVENNHSYRRSFIDDDFEDLIIGAPTVIEAEEG